MNKLFEGELKTFIKFWLVPLGIVLVICFIFQAFTGILIIALAIFLALAIRPLAKKIENLLLKCSRSNKRHRHSAAAISYLIVIAVVTLVIAVIGPVVINETSKFIQNFPTTFEETLGGWDAINAFGRNIGIENLESEFNEFINNLPNLLSGELGLNIVTGVGGIANTVTQLILVLILALFFLFEGHDMATSLWHRIGVDSERKSPKVVQRIIVRMVNVVSTYVSRQVLIAIFDGCVTTLLVFILTLIFGLSSDLPIPMGLITMIFYLIPMFGQFIGGTIVTVILLFSNPLAALIFGIIYIVYAQVENNYLSPKIQGSALKLRPVIILSTIIICMYAFGLIGVIVAIPIVGCIKVFIEEYPALKSAKQADHLKLKSKN